MQLFSMDQVVLEPERKILDAYSWSRSRNLSIGSTVLVPTTANLARGCYLHVF